MSHRIPRDFDIRTWGFRRSYPTGIRLEGTITMQCTRCEKAFGRGSNPLPIELADGEFDYCTGSVLGQRCMSREYSVFQRIELEAMPIGRVQLPSGRQGTWTARGK
jgi:hypothetical protein